MLLVGVRGPIEKFGRHLLGNDQLPARSDNRFKPPAVRRVFVGLVDVTMQFRDWIGPCRIDSWLLPELRQ